MTFYNYFFGVGVATMHMEGEDNLQELGLSYRVELCTTSSSMEYYKNDHSG